MSILNRLRLATPPLGEEGWKSYATENFRRIAAYLNRSFLQSDNYDGTDVTTGDATLGWRIESSGKAEFLDVLVRGELNAEDIVAGILDVDRISAKSITIQKLVIGSVDNLLQDPGFETGSESTANVNENGGNWFLTTDAPRTGLYALAYDITGQTARASYYPNGAPSAISANVQASEGEVFYFSFWCRGRGPSSPWPRVSPVIIFRDESGAIVSGGVGASRTAPGGSYEFREVSHTAPAGTAYVTFSVEVENDSTAGTRVDFDDLYARRKVGTLVIEDRAVDIQRLLEPVKVLGDGSYETDIDLSTSNKVLASGSVTIPSWAGTASGIGMGTLTIGNPEGSSYYVYCQVNLGGDSGGEMFDELAPSPGDDNWENITAHNQTVIAAAGSTFSGDITGRHSGTTTWNVTTSLAQFNMLVTFTR